jgi:hypothetical protein
MLARSHAHAAAQECTHPRAQVLIFGFLHTVLGVSDSKIHAHAESGTAGALVLQVLSKWDWPMSTGDGRSGDGLSGNGPSGSGPKWEWT